MAEVKTDDQNVEKRNSESSKTIRETTEKKNGRRWLPSRPSWLKLPGKPSMPGRPSWLKKPNLQPKAWVVKMVSRLPKPKTFEWKRSVSVAELGLGIVMLTQLYLVEAATTDFDLMFAILMGLMLFEKGKSYEPALIACIVGLGRWQYGEALYIAPLDYTIGNFGLALHVLGTSLAIAIQAFQLSRKS